jgi:hypothetical protein
MSKDRLTDKMVFIHTINVLSFHNKKKEWSYWYVLQHGWPSRTLG